MAEAALVDMGTEPEPSIEKIHEIPDGWEPEILAFAYAITVHLLQQIWLE